MRSINLLLATWLISVATASPFSLLGSLDGLWSINEDDSRIFGVETGLTGGYEVEDVVVGTDTISELRLGLGLGLDVPASGGGRGWLARFMALGGEGEVVIRTLNGNISFPHRPAAFPQHLTHQMRLPTQGQLLTITSFPDPPSTPSSPSMPSPPGPTFPQRPPGPCASSPSKSPTFGTPLQGCLPSHWPPIRWSPPPAESGRRGLIALVERGGCDFAKKVLAAQERGAEAVIVGDTVAKSDEGREEGRFRTGGLITMFSPEETENIHIPSVFISRASYLDLLDLLSNQTLINSEGGGLWVEISDGVDDNATLGSMLSFALLMPSCFLLATIAIHRFRAAKQKELDRAPATVVLSLPERVWQPDIVWEKDDDSPTPSPGAIANRKLPVSPQRSQSSSNTQSLPPPISSKDVATPPALDVLRDPFENTINSNDAGPSSSLTIRPTLPRNKSGSASTIIPPVVPHNTKRRYFSKDECAICMDEFHAGDIVRILPCGHVFHKEECDEWLLKWRKLCPTCRADVTLPPGTSAQGVRITPVNGVSSPENDEDDDIPNGTTPLDRISSAGRSVSAWMDRTRGNLFGRGRRIDGQESDGLGERTPLIDTSANRTNGSNA